MKDNVKSIFKYTIIISIAVLSSRILGMFREVIQTNYFGLSLELAAFRSARLIPNILRELLAEGAFSTAFITVFAGMIGKKSDDDIKTFVNKALLISFIFSIAVIIGLYLLAPVLVPVIHKTEENLNLTIELFKILLPFILLMSLSSIFMGFLNSHNKFGIPAWAPFFSNVAFILTLIFTKDKLGVHSLPVSMLAGGVAQFLFQIPSFIKSGYRPKLVDLKLDEDLKRFFSLFFPFALTMAIPMLYTVVSNPIVTEISEYGNVALYNSFFLIRFVLSLVAFSVGTVSLPNLSRFYSNEKYDEYAGTLKRALSIVIVISIPIVIGSMLLSFNASSFVWRDITFGQFGTKLDNTDIREIGYALFLYSPAILFSGLNTIIHRGFQSMKMWVIPLIVGLSTVALHFVLSFTFSFYTSLSYHGIALSFSMVSFINFIILFIILQKKMKVSIKLSRLLPTLARSSLSASVMGVILFFIKSLLNNKVLFNNVYLNRIGLFGIIVFIGFIIYFIMMLLLKDDSVKMILKRFFKKKDKI
jgi:putative peptidoglycan lipid II flippase